MEKETGYTIWDAVKRLDARLDALEARSDLMDERVAALAERITELERVLDATNKRTSKQHYALEKRFAEFKRLAGFRDKLIEKQHGMLAEQDGRIDALNRLVSGHVSATHDKESVATHMHFSAHEYRFEKLAGRVAELEGKMAECLDCGGKVHPAELVIPDGWIDYDCTCGRGDSAPTPDEHHAKDCPCYCPF